MIHVLNVQGIDQTLTNVVKSKETSAKNVLSFRVLPIHPPTNEYSRASVLNTDTEWIDPSVCIIEVSIYCTVGNVQILITLGPRELFVIEREMFVRRLKFDCNRTKISCLSGKKTCQSNRKIQHTVIQD